MRLLKTVLAITMIAAMPSAFAVDTVPAPAANVTASSDAAAAVPTAPLFLKPVFLRGVLGDQNVQVNIRPKEQVDEGLEGEYFIFGRSLKILLAGEMEGTTLFMEESENGTDISGQWDGKLNGDTLTGSWMSADGTVTKPFSLTVIPAETLQPVSHKKVSATAKK
ncbi:MAG TPA: hypothetical protein VN114_03960 [Oxalicibacterium sp.]|uniref:hypothetical protein n=1 Tax=Oxalicibacterium sp. TaxID=2766525 RepID=UPI002CC5849D|nr:hypothetical protein [Oxalicibacterium sp.]HWU97646.1 hypothetical protein [Oxalicibacterium sp.]